METHRNNRIVRAADLFCGAGGFSAGLLAAVREAGYDVDLLAVNHWDVAIATHSSNHPGVRHLCESLDGVDPRKVVPDGRLDILLASPECTHHSNARGGKPMSDQSRATAWHILRWAEALYIENIIVENVREFRDWGPLDENGRPIKSKKGQLFRQFIKSLQALGYRVDHRILNAADYGDATTRHRLFIQASRTRKRINWPNATHLPAGSLIADEVKPYRTAREIIDWSIEGQSIYSRKRPLSENTMKRIMAGLEKYSGLPFVVNLNHTQYAGNRTRCVKEPLPTLTTKGEHALVQPYLVVLNNNCDAKSVDEPLPTIVASGGHLGVCQPFLVKYYEGSDACSIDDPLPTVTANYEHMGLCQPFIVPNFSEREGQTPRCHSIDDPLPTVTGHGAGCLVQPYIIEYHGSHDGKNDGDKRVRNIDDPLPTLDTSNRFAVVQPFIMKYNGEGGGPRPIDEPLGTITTKDRFGLVTSEIQDGEQIAMLDIRFRMLQPHELAAAMSFPEDYKFSGNRGEQVKQIGNAVPVRLAAALCKGALSLSEVVDYAAA